MKRMKVFILAIILFFFCNTGKAQQSSVTADQENYSIKSKNNDINIAFNKSESVDAQENSQCPNRSHWINTTNTLPKSQFAELSSSVNESNLPNKTILIQPRIFENQKTIDKIKKKL